MGSTCVIAPHPDDEVLSCALTIQKALEQGEQVSVVFITNGDFEGKHMGEVRAKESLQALKQLGVADANISFFGYGDTGMENRVSFVYRLFYAQPGRIIPSKCANKTYHPLGQETFHYQQHGEEAAYTSESLLTDLETYLSLSKPSKIYCPCYKDKHGDHKGTYLFVQKVLQTIWTNGLYRPKLFTYLIHVDKFSLIWPNRKEQYFKRPYSLSPNQWKKRIIVTVPNSIDKKYQLVSIFQSQIPEQARRFLYSFVKDEEIFWVDDTIG